MLFDISLCIWKASETQFICGEIRIDIDFFVNYFKTAYNIHLQKITPSGFEVYFYLFTCDLAKEYGFVDDDGDIHNIRFVLLSCLVL
jgi:hypothetical protein